MQSYWRVSHLFFAIVMLLSMYCGPVDAYYYKNYTPCYWRDFGNWLEVEVDFLFWKPCIDRLDVAAVVTQDEGEADVRYKNLCPEWQGGYAFTFFLPDLFFCWDVSLSYWHLNSEDSICQRFENADEENGIVSPMLYNIGQTWECGEERLELCYGEWELLFHRDLVHQNCRRFAPYLGIAALYVVQDLEGKFSRENGEATVEVEWRSCYTGVGIRAGGQYARRLSSCVMFFANGDLTLLTGETEARFEQWYRDPGGRESQVEIPDNNLCHCVQGYRFRTGFALERRLCGWDYAIRLGYEFAGWHNLSNQRAFFATEEGSTAALSSSPRVRTLGYHGLFAGVSVRF